MAGKTKYICSECGYTSPKWLGKCPNCDTWGSFEEEIDIKKTLSKINTADAEYEKKIKNS